MLFDRKLLFRNHFRHLSLLKQNDFLYQEIASQMIANLQIYQKRFQKILIIGDKLGNIKQALLALGYDKHNIFSQFTDLLFDEENLIEVDFSNNSDNFINFDLVISLLSLHFINNPPSFLQQVKQLLKNDGLFLASFFGEEHLPELFLATQKAENEIYQRISARMPPLLNLQTVTNLLAKVGFQSPTANLDIIVVEYQQINKLLQDLKIMGCSNVLYARSKNFITKKFLQMIEKFYPQQQNKSYLASFSIIHLAGHQNLF
jgi:SAM-dependent methyltransferase